MPRKAANTCSRYQRSLRVATCKRSNPCQEYWYCVIGLFKLVATLCERKLSLVGWQRAPADVVADILLTYTMEWYWAYWPRDVGELAKGPSYVVIARTSVTNEEVKALNVEVVELVHSPKHLRRNAIVHCGPFKRLIQLAE